MRRVKGYVHVGGVVYGPGDVPSEEHAARIKNPDAWEDGGADTAPAPAPAPAPADTPQTPASEPKKAPAKTARKAADTKGA